MTRGGGGWGWGRRRRDGSGALWLLPLDSAALSGDGPSAPRHLLRRPCGSRSESRSRGGFSRPSRSGRRAPVALVALAPARARLAALVALLASPAPRARGRVSMAAAAPPVSRSRRDHDGRRCGFRPGPLSPALRVILGSASPRAHSSSMCPAPILARRLVRVGVRSVCVRARTDVRSPRDLTRLALSPRSLPRRPAGQVCTGYVETPAYGGRPGLQGAIYD